MTGLTLWTIPTPFVAMERSERGPMTALWCESALLAVFATGQHELAERVAALLDEYGMVDVPDTCLGAE